MTILKSNLYKVRNNDKIVFTHEKLSHARFFGYLLTEYGVDEKDAYRVYYMVLDIVRGLGVKIDIKKVARIIMEEYDILITYKKHKQVQYFKKVLGL